MPRYEDLRFCPSYAPKLKFGLEDQKRAWEESGANCGPGTLAGICGSTPRDAVGILGAEFERRRATTEIMLREGLKALGVSWRDREPGWPEYGICRIQWDGPWIEDPDPFEKLGHSHWIGAATRDLSSPMIFDINAISVGGWISLREWDQVLRPWLLGIAEPDAPGGWWISETLEIPLPPGADPQSSGKT